MIIDSNPIVSFLLPESYKASAANGAEISNILDVSIQWAFLVLIFGLVGSMAVSVSRSARPRRWEENWHCGKGKVGAQKYLDAEHGSVHDISDAVATSAEKLAEILPGILLVIGLLGTFIGLGLALNEASRILQSSKVGDASTVNSMDDMTRMLSNLGMKFKTSTWGILGFLMVSLFNWLNGFEKHRLEWAVSKTRSEMDRVRRESVKQTNDASAKLVSSIVEMGMKICTTLTEMTTANKVATDRICADLRAQDITLEKISKENGHTGKSLKDFLDANAGNLLSMKSSAATLSTASTQAGAAANLLASSVGAFERNVNAVLQGVKQDLNSTIISMDNGFKDRVGEMSRNLNAATTNISSAVNSLSSEVKGTMTGVRNSVNDSLGMQKNAMALFTTTATTLNVNVETTRQKFEMIGENIQGGLRAVSESGRKMEALGKDCHLVLEAVKGQHAETTAFYDARLKSAAQSDRSMEQLEKDCRSVLEEVKSQRLETSVFHKRMEGVISRIEDAGEDLVVAVIKHATSGGETLEG